MTNGLVGERLNKNNKWKQQLYLNHMLAYLRSGKRQTSTIQWGPKLKPIVNMLCLKLSIF